jgi:hypothetical protein
MTTQPEAAVEVLRSRGILEPVELAIGVGPQLGALAENLENAIGVPYSDLPGFPEEICRRRVAHRRHARRYADRLPAGALAFL